MNDFKRTIVFSIPEEARGKERPRLNPRSFTNKKVYTPTKTLLFERTVIRYFTEACGNDFEKLKGPIAATIYTYSEIPKSYRRKTTRRNSKTDKYRPELNKYKITKPDCDNIAKSILDALNKIAYNDDAEVAQLNTYKLYGEKNEIIVTLTEL